MAAQYSIDVIMQGNRGPVHKQISVGELIQDGLGSPLGIPSAEAVNRLLTVNDNGKSLICAGTPTFTLNTGMVTGFGCAFKGSPNFTGTATINDVRVSGTANPWCALKQIGLDVYDLISIDGGGSGGSVGATTIWASATLGAGNAVIAQGSTTYGTDEATALQALLNSAAGGIFVLDGQYSIGTPLAVPSNATIVVPRGCGLIANATLAGPMLYNAGLQSGGTMAATARGVGGATGATNGTSTPATLSTVGAFLNTNIRIVGGYFNCNGQNRSLTYNNTYSFFAGLQFFGVDGVLLEGVQVYDSVNYGHWFCNSRNIMIENGYCDNTNRATTFGTDNYHFNGPCAPPYLHNVRTMSFDDHIAFNADDGGASDQFGTPFPWPGAIQGFVVDGWEMASPPGGRGLRLLSSTQRIDRGIVTNVRGTAGAYLILINPYYSPGQPPTFNAGTSGGGNYGEITFSNWLVTVQSPASGCNDVNIKGNINIDAPNGTFVFDDVRITAPTVAQSMFWIESLYGNDSAQDITISNCEYNETTTGNNAPMVTLNGRAKRLTMDRCRSTRASTIAVADSPLLVVTGVNGALAADSISLTNCYTDNVNSMVELSGGRVGYLKVSGYHHNSGTGYGVAVSGATIDNFDSTGLATDANSGTNWHVASGTITNNITTGGTFTPRVGIPALWDGLMAYWRMAETSGTTVADQLGVYPLTANRTITNGGSSPISGKVSAAFGSSQWYLSGDVAANAQRLVQCAEQPMPSTVMGWANFSTVGTTQIICCRGEVLGANDWLLSYILAAGTKWETSNGNSPANIVDSGVISTGTWYHFAVVTDPFGVLGGGSKFYCYLNGVLVGSAAWVVPPSPIASDPFALGAGSTSGTDPIVGTGMMCAWGVWAVPLNIYQVNLAYNGGTGLYVI